MLKITESFVASAFRVDDNEVIVGSGGAGAENGGSIVERKVYSITLDNWLDSRGGSYENFRRVCDIVDIFSLDLASKLPEHTRINDRAIKLAHANGFIRLSKLPLQ